MHDIIPRNAVFVSALGGMLEFTQYGETLLQVPVPPGRHPAADFLDLLPPGAAVEVSGVAILLPPSSFHRIAYGEGSHDSGANPDYQPTSASRLEMEMRLMIAKMQASTTRLDARERALASIERIPSAPSPEVDPVVE